MKEKFAELFEYNFYFNDKLISFVSENFKVVPEKTMTLLNHLVNAQQIWNARINGESEFEVWQINEWNRLTEINQKNYENSLQILNSLNVFDEIDYKNSKGQKFSNTIEDVLFHVINHSTYHRAQIATDIKNHGIEPMNSDYIFYKRKLEE